MLEYQVVRLGDPKRGGVSQLTKVMNEMGAGGWRLVETFAVTYGRAGIFEREVVGADVVVSVLGTDATLSELLSAARDSGEWSGRLDELIEIAAGERKVGGIGPARRERLAELIETG